MKPGETQKKRDLCGGGRDVKEPERVDEGSAGEHGGEGAPLGGELLRKPRGVLRQRHREVFLGIEDEQLTLGPGGGGAVGGHGRGW